LSDEGRRSIVRHGRRRISEEQRDGEAHVYSKSLRLSYRASSTVWMMPFAWARAACSVDAGERGSQEHALFIEETLATSWKMRYTTTKTSVSLREQ